VTEPEFPLIENLPEAEREAFSEWLSGQTCPLVTVNGKFRRAYFPWDYERWVKEGKKKDQNFNTWD
jgi:hypothetical protein